VIPPWRTGALNSFRFTLRDRDALEKTRAGSSVAREADSSSLSGASDSSANHSSDSILKLVVLSGREQIKGMNVRGMKARPESSGAAQRKILFTSRHLENAEFVSRFQSHWIRD
jgi:hypothetical protein